MGRINKMTEIEKTIEEIESLERTHKYRSGVLALLLAGTTALCLIGDGVKKYNERQEAFVKELVEICDTNPIDRNVSREEYSEHYPELVEKYPIGNNAYAKNFAERHNGKSSKLYLADELYREGKLNLQELNSRKEK